MPAPAYHDATIQIFAQWSGLPGNRRTARIIDTSNSFRANPFCAVDYARALTALATHRAGEVDRVGRVFAAEGESIGLAAAKARGALFMDP
jgi:hypothetical protein